MPKMYLVEGEHPWVPGLQRSLHLNLECAKAAAVRMVETIANDHRDTHEATFPQPTKKNWEKLVERLQDWHGAACCGVYIIDLEIEE